MTLCVGDTFLKMAPVDERMNNITHVPCIILRMFEEFNPLVGNCHGEAVIKPKTPGVCRDAKKWHPGHIFSNGNDIGEECVQGVVCL